MNYNELKSSQNSEQSFSTSHFIREIGRGVKGARSLSFADANQLFKAIIDGRVSDLELGAILLSMRIKGESVSEIAGFLQAAESSFDLLRAPQMAYSPIVIPSYNGARRTANLTPLLALLLARSGAPVLVHGVLHDAGRVTSAEIFHELDILPAISHQDAEQKLQTGLPVLMPIEVLAPRLSELLALRKILGLRNSNHTLVKILQPFAGPALRLVSFTHPEYATMLSGFFSGVADPLRGDVFLMRGTEGETVASTKKVQQIDWFRCGEKNTLVESQPGTDQILSIPLDAAGTAGWIQDVLQGREAVPENIAEQVRHCLMAAKIT